MKWKLKIAVFALAAGGGLAGMVQAAPTTLQDGNAIARIDPSNQMGMFQWSVGGVNQLAQQWFWVRTGSSGPEQSIDSLSLAAVNTADLNGDGFAETMYIRHEGAGYRIETTYTLSGGTGSSKVSDIAEVIKITKTDSGPLALSFFQYSDFNLGGNANDKVFVKNENTVVQMDKTGVSMSETVVTPQPDHWEVAQGGSTKSKLNDAFATTLNDFGGMLEGDVTWAFQWDILLTDANSTFIISKDKSIRIPAPGALLLGMLGMGTLRSLRRRLA